MATTVLFPGNDTYTGGPANDDVDGAGGDDDLAGGAGDDTLRGGPGNDRFDWDALSRAGDDRFVGGPGDDEFVVDASGDVVVESPGEGNDTVWSESTVSIAAWPDVENVRLFGSAAAGAIGNGAANVVAGNAAGNTLDGGEGDDTLDGQEGDDRLLGGAGADSLYGGDGSDTLAGGAGDDLLCGDAGVDHAEFSGSRADYRVQVQGSVGSVADQRIGSPDGADGLDAVERLRFADGGLALDTAGAAGTVYGLWWALHDRAPAPGEFSHWVGAMDALPGAGNAEVVAIAYESVFGVAPPAGDLASFTALLDQGVYTQASLLALAGSVMPALHGAAGGKMAAGLAQGIAYGLPAQAVPGTPGADALAAGSAAPTRLDGGAGGDTLTGAGGDDWLAGGEGADRLAGGAGNDLYAGGAGIDVAVIAGTRASRVIEDFGPGVILRSAAPGGELDVLAQVERVAFDDATLALDVAAGQSAGDALALLWVWEDGAPTPAQAGRWIAAMDAAGSQAVVAGELIAALQPGITDGELVTKLFVNLVGVGPDAATLAQFTGLLQAGVFTQATLLEAAADLAVTQLDPAGFAALTGQAFAYEPWGG